MLLRGLLTDNDSICAIEVDDSLHIYVVIRTGTELVFGLDEDNYMCVPRCDLLFHLDLSC